MSKLVPISPERLEKIIFGLGFHFERSKGSHRIYKHEDGRMTVIPFHTGEKISRGLLLKILRDIDLSKDEFEELR